MIGDARTVLRSAAEFATVRNIVDNANGTGRTNERLYRRIMSDVAGNAKWKRQHRIGVVLPARAQSIVKEGRALVKEARGQGRSGAL